MKHKWHIRKRVFITLVGFTFAILFAVALGFNLTIRSYIRSRVSSQLTSISESASKERRNEKPERQKSKPDDERPDRITGARGNAILLDGEGNLISVLQGSETDGELLAEYIGEFGMPNSEIIKIGEDTYAVSMMNDPAEDEQYLVAYVNVTSITNLTDRINLMLLLVILAAIVVSFLLSRHFARSFAEPVQELSSFARSIGDGNLTPRKIEFRDMEFETLAASMNRMALELQEARHKQETFFQNVSHELRTPLTSIRGNAEGIVCGIMDPQSAGKIILSESDKLKDMVDDILYLSRNGKAAREGSPEPLDLRDALSLCVSEQHAEAKIRDIAFRFDFDENPVCLPMREQDAERLFGNLISNALRYAKAEVLLVCRQEDQSVFIRIADDGPGIPEEDMEHIFDRFYFGEGGKHGIGLAIAKSAADKYHGSITAHNERGAVFDVRFPIQ